MDRISNIPDNLIGLILEKLPIIDRVKTSSLSRSWRFKWTYLTSLNLGHNFFSSISQYPDGVPLECANIVNSLVLQHNVSLREFHFWMPFQDPSSCSLFQHTISYVMRSSSLEKLILIRCGIHDDEPCALPSTIFSPISLRCLEIAFFDFHLPYWFTGLPNLSRFKLKLSITASEIISRFVSVCPRLEEIDMWEVYLVDPNVHLRAPKLTHLSVGGQFIHVSVSNPQILQSVTISIDPLSGVDITSSSHMYTFLNNSSGLQHICIGLRCCKVLGSSSIIHRLPRFDQMKNLEFYGVNLLDVHELQCLSSFCASCPNIRELAITPEWEDLEADRDKIESMDWNGKYINGDLGNLVRVNLFLIQGTKIELKIIQLLLQFSPILTVMHITFADEVTINVKLQCLKTIINFKRASTKAKFSFSGVPHS